MPKDLRTQLTTTHARDAWDHLVASPDDVLVALDYDGTLAPIVPRPDDAVAQPGMVDALTGLARRGVHVAVITGRPVDAALSLGGLDAVPGLVLLGHYGLQRWQDGELTSPEAGPAVAVARQRLRSYAAAADTGVEVEDKHHSVALHTRNAADPTAELERARPMAEALAREFGLELVPGRFVLELRPEGTDKGGALRAVVDEMQARTVLFGGDDLGDLPAVSAVQELRQAGIRGMVLCSDSPETPASLREAADLVVDGPSGVLAVLEALEQEIADQSP